MVVFFVTIDKTFCLTPQRGREIFSRSLGVDIEKSACYGGELFGRIFAHFLQRQYANPGGDMKVTNDQLEALLRQQSQSSSTSRTQSAQGSSFEAALTEQLGLENAVATSAISTSATGQSSQASMISQMLLGTTQTESTDIDEGVIQSAFDQASGTLDMWDSYVNALGSSGQDGSLRQAYSLLQGIDGQVSDLKTSTAAVRGQNTGLDSLVNELDVMTATEKFKFNRGDYNS